MVRKQSSRLRSLIRKTYFEALEDRRLMAVLAVTSIDDSGPGTLRQAILDANSSSGLDTIEFNIGSVGLQTIQPLTELPALTDIAVLDGTTQPGYAGKPLIEIRGAGVAGTSGLRFFPGSSGSTVRAFTINSFEVGILGSNAPALVVEGCYLGIDSAGSQALGSAVQSTGGGIYLFGDTSGTRIGTDGNGIGDAYEGNVISGYGVGIGVPDFSSALVTIAGNRIGTDWSGTVAIGNRNGVESNAAQLVFGTNGDGQGDASEGNLLSGNTLGIVTGGPGTNVVVAGNLIGTDISGSYAIPNTDGLLMFSNQSWIGTNSDGISDELERNIVSGNTRAGMIIQGSGVIVSGNTVGLDITGTYPIANAIGIRPIGAQQLVVGTDGDGNRDNSEGNLISGNSFAGIQSTLMSNSVVAGNLVGLDQTGTLNIGNGIAGGSIYLGSGDHNRIGTNSDGVSDQWERNTIAGGPDQSTSIRLEDTSNNVVAGNYLGFDVSGTIAYPGFAGVLSINSHSSLIGTNGDGVRDDVERNVSSQGFGFARSDDNTIAGNYIGTDIHGEVAYPVIGLSLDNSNRNLVGGVAATTANLLLSTTGPTVFLINGSSENQVIGNSLGVSLSGLDVATDYSIYQRGGVSNSYRGNTFADTLLPGIQLESENGATYETNDLLDADVGTNNFQNTPILTAIYQTGSGTRVEGTIHTTPETTVVIELYSGNAPTNSLWLNGLRPLGTVTVTTDAAGNANFQTTVSQTFAVGSWFSSTATTSDGTSTFSAGLASTLPINAAPTANAGGPYSVAEGSSILLSAAASSDPDQLASTLVYAWDFDGDGIFGEVGVAALYGNEVGVSPTFNAAALDGVATRTVSLRVTDDGGLSATAQATISILNVNPTLLIVGPNLGVRGQALPFTFNAADASASFVYRIDWDGDGVVDQTVTAGASLSISHVYPNNGNYSVKATVTDKDGGVSQQTTKAISIVAAALLPDPWNVGQSMLLIGGTSGNDEIEIKKSNNKIRVEFDEEHCGDDVEMFFTGVSRIVVYGYAGNDEIEVSESINLPAELHGDAGNDELSGGSGDDLLLGGSGNDELEGGNGRDILIGGLGADCLSGENGTDILIGSTTAHDNVDVALQAIMAEWTSTRSFAQRVANLNGVGTGTRANGNYFLILGGSQATITNDSASDELNGGASDDWLLGFFSGSGRDTQ